MSERLILAVATKAVVRKIVLALVFSLLAFFTPFILGHPQILVGGFVNTLLFLAAFFLPLPFSFPVILMPGLAALARGILFGPMTIFLFYLIPFIWLGNLTLVFVFKKFYQDKEQSFFKAAFWAVSLKTISLYLPTLVLVNIKILPPLFLTTMGFFQFLTAIFGSILSYLLLRFSKKFSL